MTSSRELAWSGISNAKRDSMSSSESNSNWGANPGIIFQMENDLEP